MLFRSSSFHKFFPESLLSSPLPSFPNREGDGETAKSSLYEKNRRDSRKKRSSPRKASSFAADSSAATAGSTSLGQSTERHAQKERSETKDTGKATSFRSRSFLVRGLSSAPSRRRAAVQLTRIQKPERIKFCLDPPHHIERSGAQLPLKVLPLS